MKKFLAIILAAMMIFAMVSCGSGDAKDTDTDAVVDTKVDTDVDTTVDTDVDTTVDTDEDTTVDTDEDTSVDTEENVGTEELTGLAAIADAVKDKYVEFAGIRASYDEYISDPEVEQMSFDEFLSYQIVMQPVEVGAEWISGFAEVPTGYSDAYMFAPGAMGVAFIVYVFEVEEGGDVDAFKTSLTEKCDPRWNICTAANTVVCENVGNTVFFSMLVVDGEMGGFTAEQKDAFVDAFKGAVEG